MGNKCFKRKSSSGNDDVPNNQKAQKKKGARYAVGQDGVSNEAYVGAERGKDGNFTNIGAVPVDADGHIIHVPGGEEQVHIEWSNGPNSERAVDVPVDPRSEDEQIRNNRSKNHHETVAVVAVTQHAKDTSSLHSASSKDRASSINTDKASVCTDREFYSKEDEHPLAEPVGAKSNPVELSDSECQSLSDISDDQNDKKDKQTVDISSDFQAVSMHKQSEKSPLVAKHRDETGHIEPKKTEQRLTSSKSSSDVSDKSDSDTESIKAEYPETNFKELIKADGGYKNPMFQGQDSGEEKEEEKIVIEKHERISPEQIEIMDDLEPIDVQITQEVIATESKHTHDTDTDSLEGDIHSESSEKSEKENRRHSESSEKSEKDNRRHSDSSEQSDKDSLAEELPDGHVVESVIRNSDIDMDIKLQRNSDTENVPYSAFEPSYDMDNREPGVEADRELSEIMMEIERIEDSLAQELIMDQNAEELSRNIVEKLDEITALRDQSEVLLENEYIQEGDREEDMGRFKHPGDVLQWYNTCMDDLNEKVGMALLELSMLEDRDDYQIRKQFQYHHDIQTALLRKKIKYTRQMVNAQAQPREEHHPAEDSNNRDMMDYYQETTVSLPPSDEQFAYQYMAMEQPQSVPQHSVEHETSALRKEVVQGEVVQEEVVEDETVIPANKQKDIELNTSGIDLQFAYDPDNLTSIRDFDVEALRQSVKMDTAMSSREIKPSEVMRQENAITTSTQENQPQESLPQFDPFKIDFKDIDMYLEETKPRQDNDNFYPFKDQFNQDVETYSHESKPQGEVTQSEQINIDFGEDTVITQEMKSYDSDDDFDPFQFNPRKDTERTPVEIKPLEDEIQLGADQDDIEINIGMQTQEFEQRLNVEDEKPVKDKFCKESDSSSDESETHAGRYDVNPAKEEGKVQEESSEEDEPQIGVNQFATPYKSEDDLWTRVESLSSQENSDDLNARFRDNILHLDQDAIRFPGQENTENKVPLQLSQSSQEDIQIANGHGVIEPQKSDEVQAATEANQSLKIVTAKTMYGSDSSESDSDTEVPEPKIVPQKRLPSKSKQTAYKYEEDSDIEEMEVNYQLIEKMKPKVENQTFSEPAKHSSESDSEVEELVNKALMMEREEQESSSKLPSSAVSQNTANLEDYTAGSGPVPVSKPGAFEDFSERLAQDIVISSSNVLASQSLPEDQNRHSSSSSSFEQINFEIQTDGVEKSHFGVQENMASQFQSMQGAQTETTHVVERGVDAEELHHQATSAEAGEQLIFITEQPTKEESRTRVIPDIRVESSSDADTEEIVKDALGSESEDSDVEGVKREYDEMMSKPVAIVKARPITTSQSDSSSDADHSDSDTEKEEEEEEEGEAQNELRETLKGDIIGSIHEITANDFKELMTVYRDQRQSFKNIKDSERQRHQGSLWEILEERRRRTDQHIHDGEDDEADNEAARKAESCSESGDSSYDEEIHNDVEESMNRAEELNQTIQLMDLEIVRQACENNNRDVADKMLEKHFELVEKMRRDKDENLAMHREKMMKRLQERNQEAAQALSSSSSDDSCNEENTTEKDKYITEQMDELTHRCLEIIKSKQDVDEQQLYDMLVQYREEQQELIRRREYEKLRMQEKLKERLKQRRKSRSKSNSESSSDEEHKKGKQKYNESDMDESFYERMLQRYKSGDLDEEQLSDMIDEHLREQEQFKKNLRHKLAQRRKDRQDPSQSMKLRMVDDMVDEKNRAAEQIRNLRQLEKEKADKKLEEKMKKKKVVPYEESPDLPPPKRPARKQQRTSEQSHLSMNYENVEYEC